MREHKKRRKGGSGKKTNHPLITEKDTIEMMKYGLHLILYQDHVAYKNTSPKGIVLSQRVAVGWIKEETPEYVHLMWDRPTWLQKYEVCDEMSGIKLLKSTIQARMFLH